MMGEEDRTEFGLPETTSVLTDQSAADRAEDRIAQVRHARQEANELPLRRALRTKRIHDELVREKPFMPGDGVLIRHEDKQKLEPQCFGPYKVLKAHPAGTYTLGELEGRVLSNLVNGSRLVKATVGESSGTLWTSSAQAAALKRLGIKIQQPHELRHVLNSIRKDIITYYISAIVVPSEDDDEQGEIRVTLRKRVGGISQRLGVITLSQSDEEISLFDWAGTAVLQSETLHEELSSLREAVSTAEETSKKLQKQLDDFLSEKQQHDEQMMAKFAGLLNEKKLKIRNQQRLLSSLNVSPDKANDLDPEIKAEASSLPPTSSKPQSRKTKRQRDAKSTSDGEASDKMDVDEAAEKDEETQSDDDGHATPQPLEEDDVETASEDEA
ncbi:hypothetical protein KEM55_002636 [Ascosphaera atra]|nr:hypothetical protein KEM55_002636 [Ascosphaera atra]